MSQLVFISGRAALENFMHGLQQGVTDVISESGYNASGKLTRSLRTEVYSGLQSISGELSALSHWKYVGNGRGPGKRPPQGTIKQWLLDKGLVRDDKEAERRAFVIARSIGEKGSKAFRDKGQNVFKMQIEARQEQIPEILRAHLRDIPNALVSQFKAFAA